MQLASVLRPCLTEPRFTASTWRCGGAGHTFFSLWVRLYRAHDGQCGLPCPSVPMVWGMKVKVLVAQSCLTLCNPTDCSLIGSSVHGIFQARILPGVGSHSLLQGIFLTQELTLGLLHCRQILYCLSH